MVFFAILFAIISRDSLSSGLAGLSITLAFTVNFLNYQFLSVTRKQILRHITGALKKGEVKFTPFQYGTILLTGHK